ncbi:hypothetical protein P0F17_000610 [Vibrio metschnikovii]|nr:hypothetical protein [Vibrio metschnikovii]
MELICTYVNIAGDPSVQHLINAKFDNPDSPLYVQGFSRYHDHPVTLRYDRIIQVFSCYEDAEKELTLFKNSLPKYSPTPSLKLSGSHTTDICFTGFNKEDKEILIAIANKAKMIVRKDVVKHLDYLCYGYNAGPKKLEKAMEQGVMILSRTQFETMIETGEVPESV